MKTIAVIGSRSFRPMDAIDRWFGENWTEDMHLVTGGAGGVDTVAEVLAARYGDIPTVIRPDYVQHPPKTHGRDYAPKERNKRIIDEADFVVAFWDGRSTGTAHAIAWATYRRKPISVRLGSTTESPE